MTSIVSCIVLVIVTILWGIAWRVRETIWETDKNNLQFRIARERSQRHLYYKEWSEQRVENENLQTEIKELRRIQALGKL